MEVSRRKNEKINSVTKLVICLGKFGDIFNILPLCKLLDDGGEKVGLMVAKEFEDALSGVGYVTPIIYEGPYWEVAKANEQARQHGVNIICVQVNGPKDEVEKYTYQPANQKTAVTDSFNREAWHLAGKVAWWNVAQLQFDKRNEEAEKSLMKKHPMDNPTVLFASGSSSSPFQYKELLESMVRLRFPEKQFTVIDLSTIKANRFCDLLGLFESAYCLITVDTAHLHLANAVPSLPVMAITQDQPTYWYGSAWRPQHRFYCRYSDFPKRAPEMLLAIDYLTKKSAGNLIHSYYGKIREQGQIEEFPIQIGSVQRDSVNSLNDKERFPMLRNVIRMFLTKPSDKVVVLTRDDNKFNPKKIEAPCFGYRINKFKDGTKSFFPAVDLFAAEVSFWAMILPEVPDLVLDDTPIWGRILAEIFKKHSAKLIWGVYRDA